MNTANKLTLLRVVMIPAFLLVLYLDAVSYTHLDVYKRQALCTAASRR